MVVFNFRIMSKQKETVKYFSKKIDQHLGYLDVDERNAVEGFCYDLYNKAHAHGRAVNGLSDQVKKKATEELVEWMNDVGMSFNESGRFESSCSTIWNLINPEKD